MDSYGCREGYIMSFVDLMQSNFGEDPQGRLRFYGLYSGIVAPGTDPLGRNRVLLQISMPTGAEVSNWAEACLPVSANSYHPDHAPHTASQIAALLTTTPVSVTDSRGDTETVPALTIVAKAGGGQLNHPHVGAKEMVSATGKSYTVKNAPSSKTDSSEKSAYTTESGLSAPGTTSSSTSVKTPEHTFHRNLPVVGQKVWVMFVAGDPEFPVWIGVQS
jgi:hypothetical protein